MKILLTGASGFLGRGVMDRVQSDGIYDLSIALRSPSDHSSVYCYHIKSLHDKTDWSSALKGQRLVIHCAARAHIKQDDAVDPLKEYRRINVDGTLNLARQAAIAGVHRFIFISSIGVNGNSNTRPFTESDEPNPFGPYAISKAEAEKGLWDINKTTGMEVVIIRPPLIYGPGAPGNFGSLLRWVDRSVPLPLGAIRNKRSLVSLNNLVDLIMKCIEHPNAANQLFLAGDGKDLSTTELLQTVALMMGRRSCLFPVPAEVLMFCAKIFGKKALATRLLDSLQVDISKARNMLDWEPPISVEESLKKCVESEK